MEQTETFLAWTEGSDRMDEWNFRPLEMSGLWDFIFTDLWWLGFESSSVDQFFLPLTHNLGWLASQTKFEVPAWGVRLDMKYDPIAPTPAPLLVCSLYDDPLRRWEVPIPTIARTTIRSGLQATVSSISLDLLDPRRISEVGEVS